LPTLAAIDIGSNSVKMTIASRQPDGTILEVSRRTETVRLGAGIDRTGRLAEDRIEATIAALRSFADEARDMGAARVLAVATEATRAAANGAEFLDRVRRETGISVEVIGGVREAELSFRGLATQLDVSGHVVVADIGGGSTELIYAEDGTMRQVRSVAVGSGRLTDRHVVADPPSAAELAACQNAATVALQPLFNELSIPAGAGVRLILVGGTGEFLGQMVPDRLAMRSKDVDQVMIRMQTEPATALAADLHIPEARARVLPAGIAMVAAMIELAQPAAISVGQSGLRAGLFLEAFAAIDPTPVSNSMENVTS
jgi:exopolyphosphatase/pppGpp-phosphohydrolase